MKAQLLSVTLLSAFSGVLCAADPTLLNLVMPDAKVVAGVNVEQAKGTPFGQWILNQIQTNDAGMQKLVDMTGFDPRRDVREVLVASSGSAQAKTGLALAKGNFDVARITAAATMAGKDVANESYGGVTILEDAKATHGIAFLDNSTVVAGDLASVKAAIDRRNSPQSMAAATLVKINQWSNAQDAWGISLVPPATLAPAQAPGGQQPPQMFAAAQNVQQAYGGIKFGNSVVMSAEAVCDTAQNATTLGDLVKFLINMAQMQAAQHPQAQSLINSVTVTPSGTSLKISASLPEDVFIQMLESGKAHAAPGAAGTVPRGNVRRTPQNRK
ncbi:MAG: hypothetical protein JST11_23580 [Acidobacteria bacterium]|nr:hypothetical protein [Acidobacteriota bacterium]